jgi:hypothetical protein
MRHLEGFGLRCVYAGDIHTGQNALQLTAAACRGADAIITNPPFRYPDDPPSTYYATRLLRDLIRRFLELGLPCWLLLPADFMHNENAAPFMPHCSDIVVAGRVKWIKDSKHDGGFENSAWFRFDVRHTSGPIFRNDRGGIPAITAARSQVCANPSCGRSYLRERSTSQFCSAACRQSAYRKRLSVTLA